MRGLSDELQMTEFNVRYRNKHHSLSHYFTVLKSFTIDQKFGRAAAGCFIPMGHGLFSAASCFTLQVPHKEAMRELSAPITHAGLAPAYRLPPHVEIKAAPGIAAEILLPLAEATKQGKRLKQRARPGALKRLFFNLYTMKIFPLIIFFFFNSASSATAQMLTGSVKDKDNKGISFVNIGIPAKAFGIISDEDGTFEFKQTSEKDKDTIQVSCIGYQTLQLSFADFRRLCLAQQPIRLNEAVYTLATTTVRPNEYEVKTLGARNVSDLECITLEKFTVKDTAAARIAKEKGLGEKSIGIEIGNKISISKGHQTFIDKIEFKTCVGSKDTAIYRVNVYIEGNTVKRIMTPVGMVKVVNNVNVLKEGIIVKAIGKTEVHSIDVSKQNIEVFDDFIVALECIYSSDTTMQIGAQASLFGSTDLLFRSSVMSEWVKIPLVNLGFIGATVTYNKKKVKKK